MDKVIIGIVLALVVCSILLIVVKVMKDRENAGVDTETEEALDDDSNPVVEDDDSEDESGDEDDKLVEEFSARESSTYPARPRQVDLRTNLKLNGNVTEEIVTLHQSVSGFKPTVWLSADKWKMNTWYDMSGNANNMTEHNAITKRKNASGSWGCDAEFNCIGSDKNGGLKIANGWPSGRDYTLVHMTRYTDRSKGRIWNNVTANGVNWLSGHHSGCVGRSYHNGWIDSSCTRKDTQNWVLVSDQYNYMRSQQAGGVTKSRRINNRRYRHPVNGIGINSWSHPWGRGREYSGFEIAEVIVFDTILTQTQLRLVEKYMQKKYGIV